MVDKYHISLSMLILAAYTAVVVQANLKIDCHLDYEELDASKCIQRGCIWDENPKSIHLEEPNCYLNLSKVGYQLLENEHAGKTLDLSSGEAQLTLKLLPLALVSTPKFVLFKKLSIHFTAITSSIIRFRILDTSNVSRYEVPIQKDFPLLKQRSIPSEPLSYSVTINDNAAQSFGFKITRTDNHNVIWDSTFGGGLLYSDQFLQIASKLSTQLLYGMGENTHNSYLHNLNYKTWPLFAFDQPPDDLERNSYGVHPFMMLLEPNTGTANGIFFLNSNAQEYTLLPDPAIVYKTSGGILDFFLFIGKQPEDVVQQYLSLIGRPMMPPFWGLGFQLSRYGYKDTTRVKRVIERNQKQNIPVDVHYVDIDYMNVFQDFTYDEKNFTDLPMLVAKTRAEMELRWIFIIDAAIQGNDQKYTPFVEGYSKNLFVRWDASIPVKARNNPTNVPLERNVFYGRVWPRGPSAFPDFFKNATAVWWENNLRAFYKKLPYDGIWIDMNEPANFDNHYEVCPTRECFMSRCPPNRYDYPEARLKAAWVHNRTEQRLSYRTLCLATRQGETDNYLHYDVHSLYALTEAIQTNRALANILGRRSLIVTRSSYVTAGRYTAHWTGDNTSQWSHLRRSLLQMLEFNLFGIPWVGADICGFKQNTTPELCLRWSQLGAFYPFSRNHNDIDNTIDQDPAVWVEYGYPNVTEAARASLHFRYRHLHYYYTLFYKAHTTGQTVIRPLFHEFSHDQQTHRIEDQFMVGPSIIVAPFLYENQNSVKIYLPTDTLWYDLNGETNSGNVSVQDSGMVAPVYFRAGSIIPVVAAEQTEPIRNTKHLRQMPLCLNVYPNKNTAEGTLYWDDGESLDSIEKKKYNYFEMKMHTNTSIQITALHTGYTDEHILLDQIRIYGQFLKATNNSNISYVLQWKNDHNEHKAVNGTLSSTDITFKGLTINLNELHTGASIELSILMKEM